MKTEKETILSLVALGRITPREAERLLAAWNAGREEIWIMGVCAAVFLAQGLPAVPRMMHALLPGGLPALLHAAMGVTNWIGGRL